MVTTRVTSSRTRVLVVGDVVDDIQVTIPHAPRPNTDTPAVIRRNSGGSAANTAVWLATTNVPVEFYGRVGGPDLYRVAQGCTAAGVVATLQADDAQETGAIVMIVEGETRTMLSDRGANLSLDVTGIEGDVLQGVAWLHLTGYSVFHRADPEAIFALIARATNAGVSVMVDASSAGFLKDFGEARFLELVAGATLLRCNEDEAALLRTGRDALQNAASLAEYFPIVVVTRGSGGAVVAVGGSVHEVPAVAVKNLVDPTGAGDAFNAGLLQGLVQGLSPEAAAAGGAILAAQAVSRWGARP